MATTRTVVYGFGGGCPPAGWANPAVRLIRWHDWRRLSASGHGTHLQFNGTGFTGQAATISLSAAQERLASPRGTELEARQPRLDLGLSPESRRLSG